jgi:hypothetical protein
MLLKVGRLVAVTIAALSLAGCHRGDLRQSLQRMEPVRAAGTQLLAVYQPWFGEREHVDVGYRSNDPEVLAQQVDHARELNISGFLVNWYGPRKSYMDRAYALLQKTAAEKDFKVVLQYDEAVDHAGAETEAVMVDLQYAYDKYIGPDAPHRDAYLRFQGKPVIFIFPKSKNVKWDQVRRMTQRWEDPPLLIYKDERTPYPDAFDGYYAWVHPGEGGWKPDGSNWGKDYLESFYTRMQQQPNKIAVGSAWPGFDDSPASWSRNRRMDYRCGRTFEDTVRLFRRFYGESDPLPFLLIVTWNDYEEGTAIERGLPGCGSDARSIIQASRQAHRSGQAAGVPANRIKQGD